MHSLRLLALGVDYIMHLACKGNITMLSEFERVSEVHFQSRVSRPSGNDVAPNNRYKDKGAVHFLPCCVPPKSKRLRVGYAPFLTLSDQFLN